MNDDAIIVEAEMYSMRIAPSTDDISGNSRDRSSFGFHVSQHIFRSVYSHSDLQIGMYLFFARRQQNERARSKNREVRVALRLIQVLFESRYLRWIFFERKKQHKKREARSRNELAVLVICEFILPVTTDASAFF